MKKLTNKQQVFIDEYLIDLNATQAAIRAGYSGETASEQGCRLLSNVKVQKAIQEAQKERREANDVTRESISQEIDVMIAMAREIASEGNPSALTPWGKALETKAKLYGLFTDTSQVNIQNNIEKDVPVLNIILNGVDDEAITED